MGLFLFGTLLHLPLLEEVSGMTISALTLRKARRQGFRVSAVAGEVFPMMHEAEGEFTEGILVEGLTDTALKRLDYYERAFGYNRVEFAVTREGGAPCQSFAYMPEAGRWQPGGEWLLSDWATRYGALTVATAREAMAMMELTPPEEMGKRYPLIMARAASYLRASEEHSGRFAPNVIKHAHRKPYAGFFAVDEVDLQFRKFNGEMSDVVDRTVFMGFDCSVVLPYDPARDRVLLVEQFRPGAYLRGDSNAWTIEAIAGRIDPFEGPKEAALREAKEEAGLQLRRLFQIGEAYPSPGTTSEYFYIYLGLCDLPDGTGGIGGEVHEAEDIRSMLLPWAEFDRRLQHGDFNVLPLVVAGHWLARNRTSIRQVGAVETSGIFPAEEM